MTFTYRYRKQILIGIFSLLLLSGGGGFFLFSFSKTMSKPKKVLKVSKKEEKTERNVEVISYKIDIKGEVRNPGIYTLSKESRVMDAIDEAGGLTETADTSVINLSKKITDEMVIIVYSYQEVSDFAKTKEKEEQVQLSCNSGGSYELSNDACIGMLDEKEEKVLTGSVSINGATKEELMSLPGIGEAKAVAIIEYREKNGAFEKIEDIQNVSGIGESLFAKIKENITT